MKTVDALRSKGTVYIGFDGLNRPLWRNTTNSPTGAYVAYTYDESGHGDGIGHVTTEAFNNNGTGAPKYLYGSHSYTYDERGQVTSQTDSYDGHGYTFSPITYDDAGHQTSLTFSDGEVLGTSYSAQGWLNAVQTTPSGGSATVLASGITYSGVGGAAGDPTSASIANGTYTYTASFDNDLRLTTDSLTTTSATLYSATRGYDGVGNVVSENTALGAATTTDAQLFCYDEQNRLTWAGATGTSPCNGAVSSGTLTSAYYTQAYSYDAQGRLTSASLGSYTYGDSSHPHAVTAIGSSGAYTASYDAAGDMTCRAPNSSVTCAGTPTGQAMTYDAERRLSSWQNTPTTPTVQTAYLYDGEGQRIEAWANTNGTQTTTGYLMGGLEERASTGTITKYLGAKGVPTAVRVGTAGSLNYLAADGLGSVSLAVDGSGNVVASQVYAPYGTTRYSNGVMPTSRGFTGQRADATTGLDYYGARYYDPVAGQFTSADSVADGLSRYGYVEGNPETATDPSGHLLRVGPGYGGGGRKADRPYPYFANQNQYYIDTEDSGGMQGQVFKNFNVKGAGGTNPATDQEVADGQVLFNYFGGNSGGPSLFCVPDSAAVESIYNSRADYELGYITPGLGIGDIEIDALDTSHTVPVDLYSPQSGTSQKEALSEVRQKGNGQASIVAVDISNCPALQAALANGTLGGLTQNQVQLNKDNAQAGKSVARVIYIDNGQVVEDDNEYFYGPPAFANGRTWV